MTNQEKLSLYTSIFRGRTDVYPSRWEKGDRSGWTPAYSFDWNEFSTPKARGGTMKDFEHKTLRSVTAEVILNHLLGKETVGIYPRYVGLPIIIRVSLHYKCLCLVQLVLQYRHSYKILSLKTLTETDQFVC